MTSLWDIPQLPFIYKSLRSPSNGGGLPDFMPFRLGVCSETGRIVQLSTPELEKNLHTAYADGSIITGILDDQGPGLQYADDFMQLLGEHRQTASLKGKRVLDIGCGTGYLLHRMKAMGADVIGVEPGPQGAQAEMRFDVQVVRDFFPCRGVEGAFDLIVMYLLIEHMASPGALLARAAEQLKPGGAICIVVQNEEPYIRQGDVSLLFHEHYSYFSASTLYTTLARVGAHDITVTKSTFSNLLFALARFDGRSAQSERVIESISLAVEFKNAAQTTVANLGGFLDTRRSEGKSVGMYVPSRGVNLLAMTGRSAEELRFFDDNAMLHGSYFPGFDIAVENRADLLRNKPDSVLIMSLSFGRKIEAMLRPLLGPETEIRQLSEFTTKSAE